MDSESEPETNVPKKPSDAALEKALRDEVISRWKAGRQNELTVKRVRLAAEQTLELEEGFFKTTGDWKARSEEIIRNEVEKQDAGEGEEEEEEEAKSSPQPKKSAAKRSKGENAPNPRKRQKTETPVSEQEDKPEISGNDSEEDKESPKASKVKNKSDTAKQSSTEVSDAPEDEPAPTKASEATKDDSESEMSVVIDEEPKPAPKRQKTTKAPKEKKKAAPKGKDEDVDPNQAEIKRLQGWLVKCGIRKMWWRELQPYETPKEKIKHLKQMLEDAGMKGRYSLEKARQIRDERELKADLEQIQQGAKDWGKDSGDEGEGSDGGAPRRRAARGRQALAFLDSDGEETD
ncbi:hypothetical protein VI817_007687 [Penicillium citrinum]|nr:hypothetical protein VI817_007687 [Penicillium citrinum]